MKQAHDRTSTDATFDLSEYRSAPYGGAKRRQIEASYGLRGRLPEYVESVLGRIAHGAHYTGAVTDAENAERTSMRRKLGLR